MAENTVVKEQLTEQMIESGELLTKKLVEMGVPIAVAMWLFLPEINEWRLIFASDALSTAGPREVYQKILSARVALGKHTAALSFSAIGLLDMNDQLVRSIHDSLKIAPGQPYIRLSKTVLNGSFIDDALIYRIA
jgi:hypothetical protein